MRVEAETAALRTYVGQHSLRITSALSVVEVRRAAMRSGIREERKKADEVLDSVVVIKLVPEMLDLAAALDPPTLRSLDAIHLATAMFLVREEAVPISAFVVYDRRLAVAVRAAGLSVASPGTRTL